VKLAIGIATRGRPEHARWSAELAARYALGDTRIYVLADADDESMTEFRPPDGVTLDVREREDSVGAKWNRLLALEQADVYMAMCDYRAQCSLGYDLRVMEAASIFPDGIGCVVQHLANLSFPCYQAVTSRMAEVMGHIYVEHFPYWFVDHWLDDICKMSGRFVHARGDTVMKERPTATQEFREPRLWACVFDSLYTEREEICERLFAAMDEPEWRKEQLRMNFPIHHARSRMVNDLARGIAFNLPWDERYKRIRENGVAKLLSQYEQLKEAA